MATEIQQEVADQAAGRRTSAEPIRSPAVPSRGCGSGVCPGNCGNCKANKMMELLALADKGVQGAVESTVKAIKQERDAHQENRAGRRRALEGISLSEIADESVRLVTKPAEGVELLADRNKENAVPKPGEELQFKLSDHQTPLQAAFISSDHSSNVVAHQAATLRAHNVELQQDKTLLMNAPLERLDRAQEVTLAFSIDPKRAQEERQPSLRSETAEPTTPQPPRETVAAVHELATKANEVVVSQAPAPEPLDRRAQEAFSPEASAQRLELGRSEKEKLPIVNSEERIVTSRAGSDRPESRQPSERNEYSAVSTSRTDSTRNVPVNERAEIASPVAAGNHKNYETGRDPGEPRSATIRESHEERISPIVDRRDGVGAWRQTNSEVNASREKLLQSISPLAPVRVPEKLYGMTGLSKQRASASTLRLKPTEVRAVPAPTRADSARSIVNSQPPKVSTRTPIAREVQVFKRKLTAEGLTSNRDPSLRAQPGILPDRSASARLNKLPLGTRRVVERSVTAEPKNPDQLRSKIVPGREKVQLRVDKSGREVDLGRRTKSDTKVRVQTLRLSERLRTHPAGRVTREGKKQEASSQTAMRRNQQALRLKLLSQVTRSIMAEIARSTDVQLKSTILKQLLEQFHEQQALASAERLNRLCDLLLAIRKRQASESDPRIQRLMRRIRAMRQGDAASSAVVVEEGSGSKVKGSKSAAAPVPAKSLTTEGPKTSLDIYQERIDDEKLVEAEY